MQTDIGINCAWKKQTNKQKQLKWYRAIYHYTTSGQRYCLPCTSVALRHGPSKWTTKRNLKLFLRTFLTSHGGECNYVMKKSLPGSTLAKMEPCLHGFDHVCRIKVIHVRVELHILLEIVLETNWLGIPRKKCGVTSLLKAPYTRHVRYVSLRTCHISALYSFIAYT